jgi:predicted Na+-dependent transporter
MQLEQSTRTLSHAERDRDRPDRVVARALMFGMGATLDVHHFRDLARHPRAFLIGTASQFGWMPLLACVLAKWPALADVAAIVKTLVVLLVPVALARLSRSRYGERFARPAEKIGHASET